MLKNTFADKAINYFFNLKLPDNLPDHIEFINPYKDPEIKEITKNFFRKFYNDKNERVFIFGINPGRFGAGTTGISFTDPVALKEFCGIENRLGTKRELSSRFIYQLIEAYGGVTKFYSDFFITAVYPLAIIKNKKNYNYYDEKSLFELLKPEIINYIKEQAEFGAKRDLAISLGKKNLIYLNEINNELNYFKKIEFLEHPRFIMQYRRKYVQDYIKKFLQLVKT